MKRTRIKPVNRERRRRNFARAYGSEERVYAIQQMRCCACQRLGCENAHVKAGGMGMKASWRWVANLCWRCHRLLHSLGSPERFEEETGVDLVSVARELAESLPVEGS